MTSNALDPITLGVIQNGFQQICNEMDLTFVRSAFSPVITEGQDRADGIYHRETGELIAQGDFGLPIFVGTMQETTQAVIARARTVEPGDIFIVNDPYLGGTHLMDVKFVKPFFYRGRLFAWLANTGHWPDIGGSVPGGYSAHATEIEQEGLRLPPVRLFKKGELDQEILSIIMSNVRVAESRLGDIQAQAAALAVGELRLTELIDRYGEAVVEEAIVELRARATRQMRARIATIPDGTYESETFVDSDGIVDQPLHIRLSIRKTGEDLHFDLSRSSPPCKGPMNSVIATTRSAIYLAIKHVFPDVPMNAGIFDALHIAEPKGTFLFAEYPKPVSGCSAEVSQRIAEAVFAALVEAIPDRLFAASAGTCGNMGIGGFDPEKGQQYVMYYFTGGGYGGSARDRRDYPTAARSPASPRCSPSRCWSSSSRCCSTSSRWPSARPAPASAAAASACSTPSVCAAARRVPRSSWITAATGRPARWAAAMRASTRSRSRARASSTGRRTRRRTRTSSWRRATSSRCARRAAAATAIRSSASLPWLPRTCAAPTTTATTPPTNTASC